MTQPDESQETRSRIQRSRNRVFALALAAFVILVYAISIAKMG